MLGFLKGKKKSKCDSSFEEYRMDLVLLKETAESHSDPEVRRKAQEKLDELAKHHTRKINGQAEREAQSMKEETPDDR